MKRNIMRKLGLAGALAIAGLLLAPLAASADVNACSKDLDKNIGKIATDVQKELAKCVDGWLKDEDKVAANLGKGKTNWLGEGDSAGLLKAAEKCQKSIAKIGMYGTDVSTLDGTMEKTKLGKAYQTLATSTGIIGAKQKCGVVNKVFSPSARDDELDQLGWLKVADVGTVTVRLMVAAGVAGGWNTQVAANGDTSRAFQEMGNDRCSLSGVACDYTGDQSNNGERGCDPAHPKGVDLCIPSKCPDCLKFARAVDSSVGSPTKVCGPLSACDGTLGPSCVGVACSSETDCDASGSPTTDFCDPSPSQGAVAGPCYMGGCNSDGRISGSTTAINLEGALDTGPAIVIACDEPNRATGHTSPGANQCDFLEGNLPLTIAVTLNNMNANMMCQIDEVLPNAVAIVGGAGRGIRANVVLNSTPVCVDSAGWVGYIDKGTALPQFSVDACADVDVASDQSNAPGGNDGCTGFANCEPEEVDDPNNPGTLLHTGTICQDLTPAVPGVAGHGLLRNNQILGTGTSGGPDPCSPTSGYAAGEPTALVLTTVQASGDIWDLGPPVVTGSPLIIESGDFHIENQATGAPFNLSKLAGGGMDGTMVSSFGTVATNPASSIGSQLTRVVLDCNP